MLRFIDLGEQVTEDELEFAWFDTVTTTFLSIRGMQVWDSWKDFIDDLSEDEYWRDDIKRFESLIPSRIRNAD